MILILSQAGVVNATLHRMIYDSYTNTFWTKAPDKLTLPGAETWSGTFEAGTMSEWNLPSHEQFMQLNEYPSVVENLSPLYDDYTNLEYWSWNSNSMYSYWYHYLGFVLQDSYDPEYKMDTWAVHTVPDKPIPEPSTILLLGTGLLGAAGLKRKNRKHNM